MNTLRFEANWHAKLVRGWLVAILLLLGLLLSFYQSFAGEMENLQAMIRAFPSEILRGFGLDAESFGTFGGYLAYVYTFVQLLLGLLALISGMSLLGREKQFKASDFLLSKPASRASLWSQKVAVGLIGLLVINGLIWLVCFGVTKLLAIPFNQDVSQIVLGSSLVQLVLFFVGAMLSSVKTKVKSVVGPASSLGFGFYFLLIIGRLLEEKKLMQLSIYGLFDTSEVQRNGIDLNNLWIALAVILVLAGISFWRYTKQDVEV